MTLFSVKKITAFADGKLYELTCSVCGNDFEWRREVGQRGRCARFCSDTCKVRAKDRSQTKQIPCPTCGVHFSPRYGWAAGATCSFACRPQNIARIYACRRDASAAVRDRRRARLRSVAWERFSNTEIFERDGWCCMLCGEPVDRSPDAHRHRSPSLDHRVPVARGGSHTRANVQCAHWICNSRKGWKLVA